MFIFRPSFQITRLLNVDHSDKRNGFHFLTRIAPDIKDWCFYDQFAMALALSPDQVGAERIGISEVFVNKNTLTKKFRFK